MRVVLIADTFPPLRTSGAVQLRDLAQEFVAQGHELTVLLPSSSLGTPFAVEIIDGIEIVRLRTLRTKDIGYVRRTINEFLMPFMMLRNLRRSPLATREWDGVVWYSPSIFFGPLVNALQRSSGCKSYLIVRDIFPEWAVDLGIMGRGIPYLFFRTVAHYQYSIASVIGVQTQGNLAYFDRVRESDNPRVEVLENWLADSPTKSCSIDLNKTSLSGRHILVYAGNMGIAQGLGILLDLAERLRCRTDIGLLFVGRGSDAKKLAATAHSRGLNNVVFMDEIPPEEIPGLYAQCTIGIVALDARHRSHNVPGKFLTYMLSGLPVIATINARNDLANLIRDEGVGCVCEDAKVETLERLALDLIDHIGSNGKTKERCRALYKNRYRPEKATKQIINALSRDA
jgi:glycosyltransferase involved in cell wall biosynthesis